MLYLLIFARKERKIKGGNDQRGFPRANTP
jgi:hypothetical protein